MANSSIEFDSKAALHRFTNNGFKMLLFVLFTSFTFSAGGKEFTGDTIFGHVVNLPDGRVKLVTEGDSQQLEDFLMALSRRMEQYIRELLNVHHLVLVEKFFCFKTLHLYQKFF